MRRSFILLVALALGLPACGDDEVGPVFFGPIDASPVQDTAAPDVAHPTPGTLARTTCPVSATSPVRSLATFGSRGILTLEGTVQAVQLGADKGSEGCPGTPIATFGTNGSLEIDAVAATPLPDTLTLVAESGRTIIVDSTGTEIGTCLDNLVVRSLQTQEEGKVVAAFTKAPVSLLSVSSNPAGCSAETFALSSPFAFIQVAPARGGGFVTVEQASPSSPLVVARYDVEGKAVASSAFFAATDPARLCSATGLVDTEAGIFVTDSTCRRVAMFKETGAVAPAETEGGAPVNVLAVSAELKLPQTPRAAALTPDGEHVLIALARPVGTGPGSTIERIRLPL